MQGKKVCWIGVLLISFFCLNYILLYRCYGRKMKRLMRYSNLSHKDVLPTLPGSKEATSVARLVSTGNSIQKATLPPALNMKPLTACEHDGLQGPLHIDFDEFEREYWKELNETQLTNRTESYLGEFTIANGSNHDAVFLGRDDCIPIHRTAIIIPFRDRESHLKILLGHMLPILQRQGVRFSIFVTEQIGKGVFNKGRLMNTGFKYARAAGDRNGTSFDCFVFQDVDLLMENDKLIYKCNGGKYVDHLSTTINKFNYKPLCCGMTVGGVLAFTGEHYSQVNGFPNNFWGWGAEDDAMNQRIKTKGLRIKRPNYNIGRYTMIKHEREKLNPNNPKTGQDMKDAQASIDTNGLQDLNTTVVRVEKYKFFTRVYVDVGEVG